MKAIVILAFAVFCIAISQILITHSQIKIWRELQIDSKRVAKVLKATRDQGQRREIENEYRRKY